VADVRMVFDSDALATVKSIGHPALVRAGRTFAAELPSFVPVVQGVMQDSYRPTVEDSGAEVRMYPGSPFWHWMEFGTRWNPPYRPVQRTADALKLRYDPQ